MGVIEKRYPLSPGDRLVMVIRDENGRIEVNVRQAPDTPERRAGTLRVALTTIVQMAEDEGPAVLEAILRAGAATVKERRIERFEP